MRWKVVELVPGGAHGVQTMHIKSAESAALPFYNSLPLSVCVLGIEVKFLQLTCALFCL